MINKYIFSLSKLKKYLAKNFDNYFSDVCIPNFKIQYFAQTENTHQKVPFFFPILFVIEMEDYKKLKVDLANLPFST